VKLLFATNMTLVILTGCWRRALRVSKCVPILEPKSGLAESSCRAEKKEHGPDWPAKPV
jgi:hypothetical protein